MFAENASLDELVIQEEPHSRIIYDQKLREIGVIPEEAEIDDGFERESFNAGFDRRERPGDQPINLTYGVEESLFDFDALENNLNFADEENR
jgi:hypothetical protein